MFFDFHVNENLVEEAERLGYSGVALFKPGENSRINQETVQKSQIKVYHGIKIKAKNPEHMRQSVKRFRKEADVIMVTGGDQKVNRAACEDHRVDILSKPYFKRRDCGINHVIARQAAQNQVAIELNIRHLTTTRPYLHYKILAHFREILKLQRKFGFPLIITSNAQSIYDLHTPEDLMALSKCFGMNDEEAENALSQTPLDIIERNGIRDKIIVDGVRIID